MIKSFFDFSYNFLLAAFLTLIFLFPSQLEAAHIIGGDMFYECLGFKNGDPRTNIRVYRITLDLYRDCQAQNAAFFDNPAHVTYFTGNQVPYTQVDVVNVTYSGQPRIIAPPDYPCLTVPPNVCVHTARYEWEVEVPISNESFHVVWQRCCRNNTISNIFNSGSVGATFWVNITPLAQQRCNSSPQFKEFPPTVVCLNEPMEIDGSATDIDGDNLVYEFCNPLVGGGQNRNGGNCNLPTVNPNPDCPPPYGLVNFRAPAFTAQFPMGGNPKVTIDPITGLITGTPNAQGQFVVGVCVKEYRSGVLISETRRDFQFNVSSCQSNFVADIQKDGIGANNEFIVNTCGDKSIRLVNRSLGTIDSVLWVIDFVDSVYTSKFWGPTVTFPKGGSYSGMLIINPGTDCSDTAIINFNIIEDIEADFSFDYDTCEVGPVQLVDESTIEGGTLIKWDWDLAAGFTDTIEEPIVQYSIPDDYNVRLIISDEYGCKDTAYKTITWKPVPPVVVIQPSAEDGCSPLEVSFLNLSDPVDNSYDITWDFGDGEIGKGFNPTHIYIDTGRYSVKVEILSPIGCYTEEFFNELIYVSHPPIANFLVNPINMDIFDANVDVKDISQFSQGREWLFEGSKIYFEEELSYNFTDTGVHSITLIAFDAYGCADTITKYIDVAPVNTFYFPNAFSPNGDGKNDLWKGKGLLDGVHDYNLKIFNRWGAKVFESDDPREGWNGTKENKGASPELGVYIYEVKYTKARGEEISEKNFISLIR